MFRCVVFIFFIDGSILRYNLVSTKVLLQEVSVGVRSDDGKNDDANYDLGIVISSTIRGYVCEGVVGIYEVEVELFIVSSRLDRR